MRRNSNGISARVLVMAVALTLIIGGIIGGSVAWLTAKTDAVVNTFTTSDIKVELTETNATYKMVPGCDIRKDPKAKVLSGSEECFLFVKLEKSENFDTFMTYEMADGWTALDATSGVYYRKVLTDNIGTAFSVLKGDKVAVNGDVTKTQMNALTTDSYPKLTITAYASQLYKSAGVEFRAVEAWANINSTSTPTT